MVKVIKIEEDEVISYGGILCFDDGSMLFSKHDQSCCEAHYLCMDNLSVGDFEGLDFDLKSETLIEKVDGYGIRLNPVSGFPVSIPGYGRNNGCYFSDLTLIIRSADGTQRSIDISECQKIDWD